VANTKKPQAVSSDCYGPLYTECITCVGGTRLNVEGKAVMREIRHVRFFDEGAAGPRARCRDGPWGLLDRNVRGLD